MSNRRVLLVTEKPSQGKFVEANWRRLNPDDEITHFYTPPIGSFQFDLPRDLPLSQVPFVEELKLRPRVFGTNGKTSVFDGDFDHLLSQADLIVCATDPDPQGARNFLDLMDYYQVKTPLSEVAWLKLSRLDEQSFDAEFERDRRADDPDLFQAASIGRAKQYFDYQWILNSLPVFGATLREAGVDGDKSFLSKFTLQTLLMLDREDHQQWTEGDIFKKMQENPYSMKGSRIGTPISASEITTWLIASDVLEVTDTTKGEHPHYRISDTGRRLLDLLHKDCFDPDLANRIEAWGQSWPESREKVDRYIKTFFGKQKRFLSKKLEESAAPDMA